VSREEPKVTLFFVSAVAFGIGVFILIKDHIHPWVVETLCREILKCA
jgi:hypothetical protein